MENQGKNTRKTALESVFRFYVRQLLLSFYLSACLLYVLPLTKVLAQPAQKQDVTPFQSEKQDRAVDQVALDTQGEAITRLKKVLLRYHGSANEPELMLRLAEAYQQSGQLQFRITYGSEVHAKTAAHMARYKKTLKSSIEVLNRLIQGFPGFEREDSAFFMRAQAFEELEQTIEAKQDYLKLVHKYPESEKAIPAFMALAEIDIKKNNYSDAIKSLQQVERHPENPYFPFSLYKLAWGYYNLGQFKEALTYIKKHVHYFDSLTKKTAQENEGLVASDQAIRESSLLDLVLFYGEGYEHDPKAYPPQEALHYFKELEDKDFLGRMTLQFARFLRSHQHESELIDWKRLLLEQESHRVETIDVVVTVFEHQMNQHKYEQAVLTGRDLIYLYQNNPGKFSETESFEVARKALIDAASKFKDLTIKNKGNAQIATVSKPLNDVYNIFIEVVKKEDPRVGQVHYNLAETLFDVGEFEKSTEHYRWILSHWNPKSTFVSSDIELKAIASRYEILRKLHLIPEQVSARALNQSSSSKASSNLLEWIDWIDEFKKKNPKSLSKVDAFEFNANRAFYSQGSLVDSVNRMTQFALTRPSSPYSTASAMLVLDTYISSHSWEDVVKFSKELLRRDWKEDSFTTKVQELSADASFKIMEKVYEKGDLKSVLALGEAYQKEYSSSKRRVDTLLMLAQVHSRLGDRTIAQTQLSEILKASPTSEQKRGALLFRAELEEQTFSFEQAIQDYGLVLSLPTPLKEGRIGEKEEAIDSKQREKILHRYYFLSWLVQSSSSSPSSEISDCSQLSSQFEISSDLFRVCERYRALSLLKRQMARPELLSEKLMDHAIHLALKGDKAERSIWGALALTQAKDIEFGRRLSVIREVSKNWDQLDSMLRISLLPALSKLVPGALHTARDELNRVVPMNRPSMKSIVRRVEWMKEVEKVSESILMLPWSRIRTHTLLEVASLYRDFITTLEKHTSLEGLTPAEKEEYQKSIQEILGPFTTKSQELAKKAYEVAIENGVEDELVKEIAAVFPQVVKASKASGKWTDFRAIDVTVLARIDQTLDWSHPEKIQVSLLKSSALPSIQQLKQHWAKAFQAKASEKIVYFLQELQTQAGLSEIELGIFRGLTLKSLGAQAEGFQELNLALEKIKGANHVQTKG